MTAIRIPNVLMKSAGLALAAAAAAFGATAAHATNEQYQLSALSCSPYIVGGCEADGFVTTSPGSVNVGGGYGYASGYDGGFALASAIFNPGAPELLQAGQYRNSATSSLVYTFQVQGAPDTLVPLHAIGRVSVSNIRLTDEDGNVPTLVNGAHDEVPTDHFYITAAASLKVVSSRLTTYPQNSAVADAVATYTTGVGTYYCGLCQGGSDSFDTTFWVYSNSDIEVQLDASARIDYRSDGLDPRPTFGVVSAETDPVFSIDDPAYAAFSIVGVPTGAPPPIGSAVPEPASWAMMVSGFGLAGSTMRGRRRRAAPAA